MVFKGDLVQTYRDIPFFPPSFLVNQSRVQDKFMFFTRPVHLYHPQCPEVLEEIKKQCARSNRRGFPIHQQYVTAVLDAKKRAEESKDHDGPDVSEPVEATKAPKRKLPKKTVPKDVGDAPASTNGAWKYGEIRTSFIRGKMNDGFAYKECVNLWDESLDKAKLLGPIPIQELKRRKFLPKGADSNPWYKKIHGCEEST